MLIFYLIAGGAALAAALIVARPLLSSRGQAPGQDALDAQVFRDQLAEIERDLARGVIGPEEAEGARLEVSRRLLAADARARATGALKPGPRGVSRWVAAGALAMLPVAAAGLYAAVGAPGAEDRPLAARQQSDPMARPSQVEAERMAAEAAANEGRALTPPAADPTLAGYIDRLQDILKTRTDDPEGHRLLAVTLMQAGRYKEAYEAYARHIALAEDADAETRTDYAEALIFAAGGYVSPEAEKSLRAALERDPAHPKAMFYAGVTLRQNGRPDLALGMWQSLLQNSPPDAPWRAAVEQAVAEVRQATGLPPAAMPGPSQQDMDAAAGMSAEEQAEMIAGMVARLEERLITEGGEVEEWARLMFAYVQLGKPEEAKRIYALGRDAQPESTAKAFLRERAVVLGLDVDGAE